MTDERNKMDTGAETDAAVTQAYRETKDERVPESLNRAVLDQAAKAARPRYSRIILWTRPMAWAATAMLSVAIVLQLTQAPAPEDVGLSDSAPEVDAPKLEALRSTAKQVAPAAASEARQRVEQSKANFEDQAVVEQEVAAPALISPEPAQTTISNFAPPGLVRGRSDPGRCDEAATTTAETWLQCITALEEAGLSDAADEERKLLAAAFPDFDTP